jgi:transcriptional regulator with XRE-family HTH domain
MFYPSYSCSITLLNNVETDELKQLFGQRIRWLRKSKNITQEQLAENTGCSTEYISRIERGIVSPSFEILSRLSKSLDVQPKALFDFEVDSPSPDE